ncbi:unnamed protein product [Somion occarium]|uniref:Arf-GAP domain-containing protein n=1 Tax=Somion occarium TaxID=3059160 RepID=A0ABP1CQQ2_9APHY
MSRQDKAITERNAKTLRELLKRPENKFCADCKRNDPRWASWNLGVFLCIRCSGVHRSMGTHISKSITKWGNRYANLYWEAHLKPGHIPPDHKMDSFIRSKYDSKRWAKDGPPPSDPSTLDEGASAAPAQPAPTTAPPPPTTSRPGHAATSSVGSVRASPVTNRQPQPHQLLSTSIANRSAAPSQPTLASPAQQQPAQPAQAAPTPATNDLFSLDFHNPTPSASSSTGSTAPKKDVKQDILSLFSSPTSQVAPTFSPQNQFAAQAAYTQQQNAWGAPAAASPHAQPTSLMGQNGVGMWGASSGWSAAPAPAQPSLWGAPAAPAPGGFGQAQQSQLQPQQQSMFNTNDIWASPGTTTAGASAGGDLFGGSLPGMQKKDDVFGDIWGGFK